MNIQLIIHENETGKIFDMSEMVGDISWDTQLTEYPGKLTFFYLDDGKTYPKEGSSVTFKIDGKGIFKGFIFVRRRTSQAKIEITAYDQLRYLQNKDVYVFPTMTSSERFTQICKDQQLKFKVVHSSSYNVPSVVMDNESYYQMMQDAIDKTRTYSSKRYQIRDNFGTLEHVELSKLKSNLLISEGSLLLDFDFESSIDSDTFNQVKLVKDSKKNSKRNACVVKDMKNIKKWGRLQYFEFVDENANQSQIKEKANQLLKEKNRPSQTINLSCMGDLRVREGVGVVLQIGSLSSETPGKLRYALVTSCKHNFKNNSHMMDLEVEVV